MGGERGASGGSDDADTPDGEPDGSGGPADADEPEIEESGVEESGVEERAALDERELPEGGSDDPAEPDGPADVGELETGADGGVEADASAAEVGMETAGADEPTFTEWQPGGGGPEEDRELPLTAHIEEMLKRLAVVVAVAGLVSLVTFPFAERLINFLWNSLLPSGEFTRPRLYGILELKLTELKVASLVGLIVALPVLVYETYAFMRPGLYPHERRYYLAAVPTSLVLALVGVSFAYFVVLPTIFLYFTTYTQGIAGIGFALGRTFDLILLLMGYLAVVFQIPLFLMLAMMMGLVTRRWLAARRILFWGGFLGISFLFSPDPTGMAPIIVALTMIVLFEGTLFLTRWTRSGEAGTG